MPAVRWPAETHWAEPARHAVKICMLVRNACVRDVRVLREASALSEDGHDVLIIAMHEPGTAREEQRDGFRIRRIEPLPEWLRLIIRRPVIPPSAGTSSVDPARFVMKRRSPTVYALRDRLVTGRLIKAASRIAADVYHAHDANTVDAAARAAALHGGRLVYDAHDLYSELSGLTSRERARWRALEHRLIARADKVITVSESVADELVSRYAIERPIVLMNVPQRDGSVDPSASVLAPLRQMGEMLVLYSGGISPNRGLEQLAEAAGRARGWRLVMMGWGPLRDRLRAQHGAVTFVEPVLPESLIETAAAADVGVVPYVPVGLNNALSLPNKLFDYVQSGLAIAASDLVELRRFIDEERVGVCFRPGDPGAIADALNGLAADPSRLAAYRAASAEAAKRFHWDAEKGKLLEMYRSL
jgi:glycosyltransferase involved in cell wall biosynthesis